MAKKVEGFLTNDGTFLPFREDADLYDAIQALEQAAIAVGADPKKVMIVVDGCSRQIRKYLNAKQAYEVAEHSVDRGRWAERATPPAEHNTDDSGAEADDASVQQQPASGDEHLSDVGSGERTEEVQHDGEANGIGSGSTYARGIRSRTLMATTSSAALARPRVGSSESSVLREDGTELRWPDV